VSTEQQVKDLMVNNLTWGGSWKDVDGDYPLLDKRVIDSFGMLKLISLLEEEFGVEIDDEDIVPDNFGTIKGIATLVESKRS
jgi:acyl carrier protein